MEIFNILKIAWSEKVQKKIQTEKSSKICQEKCRKKRKKNTVKHFSVHSSSPSIADALWFGFMFDREKGGKTVFMKLDDLFLCSLQNVFVSPRKMKLLGNAHKYMVECMVEYIFLYLFFIFMLDLHLSPVRKRMVLISHKMFSSPLLQCPLMSGMVHLPSGIFYHSITKMPAYLRALEMTMMLI